MVIRPANSSDLDGISRIQYAAPGSARWDAAGYLAHSCWVAEVDGIVQGFIAARQIVAEEFEILDLAVAPEARNRGIGTALVTRVRAEMTGTGFLEVRERNTAAQRLYAACGWTVLVRRKQYYTNPDEDAVVMKFQK